MRRSGGPWSFSDFPDNAIPFHCRDLNANRASGEAEFRRDVLRREFPRSEQRHDPAAARIKKLFSEHFGHVLPSEKPISCETNGEGSRCLGIATAETNLLHVVNRRP